MKDFKLNSVAEYNPADYGLPIWRDEEHMPHEKTEAEQTPADNMTIEAAKNKLCMWAQSQVGTHEGANNWNKYAENADLQKMYGWYPQNQPWCDVWCDVGFIECFGLENACAMTYQPLGAGSALCSQSAQYYQEAGAFTQRPEIGDQVFFYVSGEINHTGLVVRVDGGSVFTIEGNSSDAVCERVYQLGAANIAGYGRPKWSVVTGESAKEPDEPAAEDGKHYYELRLPYLRRGDTGKPVTALQFQLAGQGYYIGPDGADGDFGANTESALKEFQRNVGLPPDGVVGPDTGARLFGAEVGKAPEKAQEAAKPGFWDSIKAKLVKK